MMSGKTIVYAVLVLELFMAKEIKDLKISRKNMIMFFMWNGSYFDDWKYSERPIRLLCQLKKVLKEKEGRKFLKCILLLQDKAPTHRVN